MSKADKQERKTLKDFTEEIRKEVRRETLKEVGDWLLKRSVTNLTTIAGMSLVDSFTVTISRYDMDTLLLGKVLQLSSVELKEG